MTSSASSFSNLVIGFTGTTATTASFTPTTTEASLPYWGVFKTYENMTMYSFAVGTSLTSSIINNQ